MPYLESEVSKLPWAMLEVDPPHTFKSPPAWHGQGEKLGNLIKSQHPDFPFAVKGENNSLTAKIFFVTPAASSFCDKLSIQNLCKWCEHP